MYHIPVLFNEVMQGLAVRPDGIYLDGTLGGGGHSAGILERLGKRGFLLAIDRDLAAIEAGRERLETVESLASWATLHSTFDHFDDAMQAVGLEKLDGVLLDLGVSSAQLDREERGFSYTQDGPLDMRMDPTQGPSAADLINTLSEEALADIFHRYGEERYSRRLAAAVVRAREKAPITRTGELSALIVAAMPAAARHEKQHPARRSFQALRIAVNDELGQLERFLAKIPSRMNPEGRVAIISFHSLEDRIVKQTMRMWENPCTCPPELPVCVCGARSFGKAVIRHGSRAAEAEMAANPRARSARLRVFAMAEEAGRMAESAASVQEAGS